MDCEAMSHSWSETTREICKRWQWPPGSSPSVSNESADGMIVAVKEDAVAMC